MDHLDAATNPQEIKTEQQGNDLVSTRKFWENPTRTHNDFIQMFTSLVNSATTGNLVVETHALSENPDLPPAFRRMGRAIGLSIDQFESDPKTNMSTAKVKDGDDRLNEVNEAKKDRVYTLAFLKKHENLEPYFRGMVESLRADLDSGSQKTSAFVDTHQIDEQDKEQLSFRRVLYRSLGYKVGPYTLHRGAGTAEAAVKK